MNRENRTVTVEPRVVYGKTLYYPVDDGARRLARMVGKATLSEDVLTGAACLGVEVKIDISAAVAPIIREVAEARQLIAAIQQEG
jgi:hypothetical protein